VEQPDGTLGQLWYKLGRLYWWLGRYAEGRQALEEATAFVPSGAGLLAARCHQARGLLEMEAWDEEGALAAFGAADQILARYQDKEDNEWVRTWLDVQLNRAGLYFNRNEVDLMAATLARAQPLIETHGDAKHKAEFHMHATGVLIRGSGRGQVDERGVDGARAAWAIAVEAGVESDVNFVRFNLGQALVSHGELTEAETLLREALAAARRRGDKSMELKCVGTLAWARMRQHDVAGVRELATEAKQLMNDNGIPPFGFNDGLLSWVAWREERFAEAEKLAEEAWAEWQPYLVRFPTACVCLLPLMAVRLLLGKTQAAVAAARELVKPPQMLLPAELEAAVGEAVSAWDTGKAKVAAGHLAQAVKLAEQLNFA
jgi:tetratricopeptide (TPR) repeat protein